MPNFRFTVIGPNGQPTLQTLIASSQSEAMSKLRQQGVMIIAADTTKNQSKHSRLRLNLSDKIAFIQSLATMLEAGVSLGESLTIMTRDTRKKNVAGFLKIILYQIEQGHSLSQTLSEYPDSFGRVFISMIEAGEASGNLAEVMKSIVNFLEQEHELNNQVKSALLYPVIIFTTLIALGLAMTFFIMPKISPVIREISPKLPATTTLLLNTSDIISGHPTAFLMVLAGLIIGLLFFVRSSLGRTLGVKIGMRLPFIKDIFQNLDLSRMCGTMTVMLKAGVTVPETFQTAAASLQNPKWKAEMNQAYEGITTGTSIATVLEQTHLPARFTTLVTVGEQSGKISDILAVLSQSYSKELTTSIKNFTAILEPLLTLLVGVIVGVVIIVLLVPIYQSIGSISSGA